MELRLAAYNLVCVEEMGQPEVKWRRDQGEHIVVEVEVVDEEELVKYLFSSAAAAVAAVDTSAPYRRALPSH